MHLFLISPSKGSTAVSRLQPAPKRLRRAGPAGGGYVNHNPMHSGVKTYPKKGDIAWCGLNPIQGHEQSGLRPCVVISGSVFNDKTGTAVVCPITSKDKRGYYFRIAVETPTVKGFIMADQIRTVDWKERVTRIDGTVSASVLKEVYGTLSVLFDTI